MKVDIRGYQIIENASIDIDGITMIIGSNNNGKSSFIRAIEAALFNTMGEDFINDKMSNVTVEISFDGEGKKPALSLWWQKPRKGGAIYSINGVDSRKLGRKSPQELLTPFGIREINVREKKERIFFWRQFDPLFMITSNPSYIFDFLSSLMEEKKMIPILKQMAADGKEKQDRMIYLEGAIRTLQDSLKGLNDKEKSMSIVEGYKDFIFELKKIKVALSRIVEYNQEIVSLAERINAAEQQLTYIDEASGKIPDMGAIDKDIKKLRDLEAIWGRVCDLQEQIVIGKRSIEDIDYIDEIRVALDKDKDSIEKLKDLLNINESLTRDNEKINWAQEMLDKSITEENIVVGEFEQFKKTIKVCPTCERSF